MIYVDKKKKEPIYRQLYSSIVAEIFAGAMPAGYRLPATRKLAQELSIGRNTVEKAYQQLEAEGYVRARTGSGFTVEQIPLDFSGKEPDEGAQSALQKKEEKPKYDFAYGPMAGENFPYKQWRRCVNDVLTEMELQPALYYPDRYGEPALQKAVCGYLKRSRNVLCRPEDILITPGQQYAMEILANLISPEERTFAMEEPGYDGIRKVFEMNEFQIIPIKIQDGSITRESLEHVDAKLLYLTPSHQFPTGAVMPVGERRKILQWAEETETYLIEDDYDSELRYYTNPIPAMQSMDAGARTIYTGTFSKSLAPVMRVSYMILPEALQEKYQQRFGRDDRIMLMTEPERPPRAAMTATMISDVMIHLLFHINAASFFPADPARFHAKKDENNACSRLPFKLCFYYIRFTDSPVVSLVPTPLAFTVYHADVAV